MELGYSPGSGKYEELKEFIVHGLRFDVKAAF